ncbi:MAG TPA: 5'-nucleotidase C-terminal domain-containing protein, partial [Gemmatimonadaceae bacterium]|nr:5'-nucleotidase C-terminal domain-containing protein [Gemmatimonadaceae bacterium]
VDVQGITVGVIGVATVETPRTTKATNVAGLRFANPARVVDAHARALRARGAEVVVVIAHAGAFCDRGKADSCNGEIVDLANAVTEKVDAIVSGHTHSGVATRVRGIPIVQAFSRGSAVGVIDLPLGEGEAPPVEVRTVRRDSVAAHVPAVAYTDSVVARANAVYDKPVAEVAERMTMGTSGTLGNFVADAYRAIGKGDVGIMNTGGVRAPLNAGAATLGHLFEVAPFGNSLVRVHVRGRDLRRLVEDLVDTTDVRMHLSGVKVAYDPSRPVGQRVTSLTFSDGRPVNARQLYTVVTLDFLLMGGDGLSLARRAAKVEDLKVLDLDALARYVRSRPQPVRAPTDARLIPLTKP